MVSDYFQGGCVCENAAGLRHGTDNIEFAALTAPRPLVLVGATGDWTRRTMDRVFPAIRGVYSLIGSRDRVSAQIFDFPHNYNQTSRNAVYAAMSHWLFRIDDPAVTREGKQNLEKPEDLWTFGPITPHRQTGRPPEQLEDYLIATLEHMLDDLAPSSNPARWEASRRLLETSLKIRTGIETPAYDSIVENEVRSISRDDYTIEHLTVGRKSRGDAIPVVKIVPRHFKNRLTILAHPRGKAALARWVGQAERAGAGVARARPRRRCLRPPVRRRIAGFEKPSATSAGYGPLRDIQPVAGRRPDARSRNGPRLGQEPARRRSRQPGRAGRGRLPGAGRAADA